MKLPSDLVEAYEDSSLIVVVGSRLSTSAGLPSLRDLALGLIECVDEWASEDEADQLRSWIEKRRTSEVLDQLKRHLGAEFEVEVERRLSDNGREVPAVARALASLRKKLRAIYTTRLDRLVERAFAGRWPSFASPRSDFAQRRRIIFKLRGTLEFAQSWVLTAEQEERELLGRSARRAMLETAYEAHRLLFIAFEPDDEELDLLLKAARAGQGENNPEHFIALSSVGRKERTALERRGLSVIRADAEDVLEALGAVEEGEDSLLSGGCPYPGLEVFTEDMASVFFGRHAEISQATAQLGGEGDDHNRWLSVEGQAGVGKSSFVLAGLLPALRNGFAAGLPERWVVAIMRPGASPIDTLAQQLSAVFGPLDTEKLASDLLRSPDTLIELITKKTPKGHGFLLVIDQLEELVAFTPTQQRATFSEMVYRALESKALYLITSMRSDFVAVMQEELPAIAGLLNEHADRYVLPPISRVGLREAITEPAALRAVMLEPALLERIVRDAETGSGSGRSASASALPLVAHALRGLWHASTSRGSILGLAEYEALGGVVGALGRSADRILANLDDEDRAAAKAMLLHMVQVMRDGSTRRRRVSRDQVVEVAGASREERRRGAVFVRRAKAGDALSTAQANERGARVLLALSGGAAERAAGVSSARLLTVLSSDGQVEVELVHESLVEDWETLRVWIDENRRQLLLNHELERRAEKWSELGRPGRGLPRGPELRELLEGVPLGEAAALQKEYQAALRRALIVRGAVGIGLVASITAASVIVAIIFASKTADLKSKTADLEANEAKLQASKDKLEGNNKRLRFSEENLRKNELKLQDEGARSAGLAATMLADQSGRRLEALRAAIGAYANYADGSEVPPDVENGVFVATYGLRELHELIGHQAAVRDVAFSSEGDVATASYDLTAKLWASDDFATKQTLSGQHEKAVEFVEFFASGGHLLTFGLDNAAIVWREGGKFDSRIEAAHTITAVALSQARGVIATGGDYGELNLWEPGIGKVGSIFGDDLQIDTAEIKGLRFTDEGDRLLAVSASGEASIINVETGGVFPTVTHAAAVTALALSADGSLAATAGAGVQVWDTSSGKVLHHVGDRTATVRRLNFAPDHARLVVVYLGETQVPELWDTDSGELVAELSDHDGPVWDAAFSPTRPQLATAGEDGSLRLWDPVDGDARAVLESAGQLIRVSFSPDGEWIGAGDNSAAGVARVWRASASTHEVLAHADGVETLYAAVSADGARVVFNEGGRRRRLSLWDGQAGKVLDVAVGVVALSPDGRTLAIGRSRGELELVDAASGDRVGAWTKHAKPISCVIAGPDNGSFATSDTDGVVVLWSKSGGRVLGHHEDKDGARSPVAKLAFAPNGKLASAGSNNDLRIWDAGGEQFDSCDVDAHVTALAFTSDGQTLAVATADKDIRLFDAKCELIGDPLQFGRPIETLAFSPDDSQLAIGTGELVVRFGVASGAKIEIEIGHHNAPVVAVYFSADGASILSVGEDGFAARWDASVQSRASLACEALEGTASYKEVSESCAKIGSSG